MEILVVSAVALAASALTLFSGFGLGTLLMPVVALFFPIEVAIAVTAMVHLANNIFKVVLLGKHANRSVLLRFGMPAILLAYVGARVLGSLSEAPPVYEYLVSGRHFEVVPIKLIVGLLILCFVLLELSPRFSRAALDRKYLPLGGAISGFFGGLSGHQGAFRSMFLLKAGLAKEEFIATGIVVAVMVDVSRMVVYGRVMTAHSQGVEWTLVAVASASAFIGAYFGARMMRKLTIRSVQIAVSALLVIIALGLVSGAV